MFLCCLLYLTLCVCGLHPVGRRGVIPLVPGICCLMDEAGLEAFAGLLEGGGWFLPTGMWVWVLALWWAGPCQAMSLDVALVFKKTLGSLSAGGWGCVSALLVVWPEASQHWGL